MKKCTVCKIEKEFSEFANHKCTKDGLHHDCRSCAAEYRKRNKEKRAEYNKKFDKEHPEIRKAWREKNKDKVLKYRRESQKRYWAKNKVAIQERHKEKMQKDPKYRAKRRFYLFIKDAFRRGGFPKTSKNNEIIGCSYDFLREYIEAQFVNGMNWNNIQIDHIKPLNSAITVEDVINLCHYTNLQPLFAPDNASKKAKIITKQLRLL